MQDSDIDCIPVFEEIIASSMAADIGPLRMAALEKARSLSALQSKYNARQLRPEVQFELEPRVQTAMPFAADFDLKHCVFSLTRSSGL